MKYIDSLDAAQKNNMKLIIAELGKSKITNLFSRMSVLAISSKECEFRMTEEISYAHTPNDRIRKIFYGHFNGISDAAIDSLKADPKSFFDHVYGGMYGNKLDQGYFYRGRGFDDVTFEGNYAALTQDSGYSAATPDKGYNLVDHPELLDKPEVAAACLPLYFIRKFHSMPAHIAIDLHSKDINGFNNIDDALIAFYRANAGWEKPIFPDTTGGFEKAHNRVKEFYELLT